MKQYITEHQSPYLDLSAEVTEILFKGKSAFQDIVVADSKEYGRILKISLSSAAVTVVRPEKRCVIRKWNM